MRLTTHFGLPVAEQDDARRDFPTAVDAPRTDQLDALLWDRDAYGRISYAAASVAPNSYLTVVAASDVAGGITVAGGKIVLDKAGLYSARVGLGSGNTAAGTWIRAQANGGLAQEVIYGPIIYGGAAGSTAIASGLLRVTTAPISVGLYVEASTTINVVATGTFLHINRER